MGQNLMNMGYVIGYFNKREEAERYGKAVKLEGESLWKVVNLDPEAIQFKGKYAVLFFWWE